MFRISGPIAALALAVCCAAVAAQALEAIVTVDAGAEGRPISPLIFGNNVVAEGCSGPAIWDAENATFFPQTLEAIRDLRPTLLRFPGGGKAEFYDWRDGVGKERRGAGSRGYFGTDEWMKLCREVGAQALITVNWSTGNPGLAADWVEYCNGPVTSKWGALRAENGHPEPYGVTYWEIGNETYSSARAEEYARTLDAYSTAMKRVDPGIKVGAVGWAWQGWRNHYRPDTVGWNETVLAIAAKDVDFFIIHPYAWIDPKPTLAAEDLAESVLSYPGQFERDLARIVDFCRESGVPDMPIFATEYNGYYGELGMSPGLLQQFNATLVCAFLNGFIRRELAAANYWELLTVGWGHFSNIMYVETKRFALRPTYHAMKLYRDRLGDTLLPSSVRCGTHGTQRASIVPAQEADPDLDAVATGHADGSIAVALVWKRATVPGRVTVRYAEPLRSAVAHLLVADGPSATNTRIEEQVLEPAAGQVTLEMPPISAAIVVIRP